MPISITSTAPGMPAEAYDAAMVDVAESLRRSAGFISHAAQISRDGVTVTELWETREQWQQWFDTSVRPHLPPGTPQPTVVEVRNALCR